MRSENSLVFGARLLLSVEMFLRKVILLLSLLLLFYGKIR